MTWSYRVIRAADGGCRIAEVYTTDGAPLWTADPIAPYGDDPDELWKDLMRMRAAFRKHVLEEAELQAATTAKR